VRCLAVFVDLFHFLLLLVTFFTGCKFCKLLFTVERGKVRYFLLLFTIEKGQDLYCIHCATGERVQLDCFSFFFTVEREGGGGQCFVFL
jgi:hypothetical protein